MYEYAIGGLVELLDISALGIFADGVDEFFREASKQRLAHFLPHIARLKVLVAKTIAERSSELFAQLKRMNVQEGHEAEEQAPPGA